MELGTKVRLVFLIGTLIAITVFAVVAHRAYGQDEGYVPKLAAMTSSPDALIAPQATRRADGFVLVDKLKEANGIWLDGKGLPSGTMVEYTNTYIPNSKLEKKEIRHIGCAYDRGVDWWMPTDIALDWIGISNFYEGADGETYVMLWEAELGGDEGIVPQMRMCDPPGALPAATWNQHVLLTIMTDNWMYGYSLESVFAKDTGLLQRERFVTLLAEGGYVIGWDAKFEYGDGGYPEKVVVRSIVPPGDEDKFGYDESVMTFEMIDGAWMMRRMERSFYEPPELRSKAPNVSITQNDDIKVVKFD